MRQREPDHPGDAAHGALERSCVTVLARLDEARRQLPAGHPALRELDAAVREIEVMRRNARATEARQRSLLDAVPDAVTVHDADGRILDANAAACAAFGYPLERLRGLNLEDINPSLPPDHMTRVWRELTLGHTDTTITTNRRADGTRFPVEVHSNAYLVDGMHRLVAVARDISARIDSEQALRRSEQHYRSLLEAVDKGIVVQDRHGRVVSANAAAARFLDVSFDELVREGASPGFWQCVDGEGRPIPWQDLPGPTALRSGRVVESTTLGFLNRRSGRFRWVLATSVPQFVDGDPRPHQVISVFGDVTELKRQSELFNQTQQLAGIGGWEYAFDPEHAYWTDEVPRLIERQPGTPASWAALRDALVPADAERLERALQQLRATGAPFNLEARVANPRQQRWVRIIGKPQSRFGRIAGASGTIQDISLRKFNEHQLRRQAMTDGLTGLANRDALLKHLAEALDATGLDGQGPALLYIDLDRFKVINDLLGHAAGDGLLVAAAQRLREAVGGDAMLARFGGDEFVAVLPASATAGDGAATVAERVTRAFASPFAYANEEFAITASVGIARAPADGATIQQLINHADAAMFEAKRRGRNKWQAFTPELARSLTDRLLLETQLRRALDNGEFHLAWQPQVRLADGAVVGAEALLRWRSRMLGELSPSVFIPHAETTGDIVRIGAWVIGEGLRQMRRWRDQGLLVPRISVNVSFRQFVSGSLHDIVRQALADTGLPGDCLELEVTERVLVEDVPDAAAHITALKQLGVKLVIDDFGEGHSALSSLRDLPFDGIKISHDFMDRIPGSERDAAMCEAVIRLAASLGLDLVAEGVEREEQRDFLLARGARCCQGYLYSAPLPAAELADYALRWGIGDPDAHALLTDNR